MCKNCTVCLIHGARAHTHTYCSFLLRTLHLSLNTHTHACCSLFSPPPPPPPTDTINHACCSSLFHIRTDPQSQPAGQDNVVDGHLYLQALSHIHTLLLSFTHTHTHTHNQSINHACCSSTESQSQPAGECCQWAPESPGSLSHTHPHTHVRTHTHTHIHTHTHTFTHTHTHTHTQVPVPTCRRTLSMGI